VPVARFVLRRLAQLDSTDCVDKVIDQIERLSLVFKDVLEYLTTVRKMSPADRKSVAGRLLGLIDNSTVGTLEYHRCWILSTFTRGSDWNHADRFAELQAAHSDEFSQRELILAQGCAGAQHWFKTRKRDVMNLPPWERRAFLAAARCLPGDEAK